MHTVRIGVIGVGVMGERHCRVCANLPKVELVGVADLDAERGQRVAAEYDTAYLSDYRALLPQIDAVTIAASTPAHYALARACLEADKHVLVEKPITETVEQAQQLVELADKRGLVLQVGLIERFNPAFTELKNVLEDLQIIAINMRRLSPFDTSNTDVDVIRDLMIHDLDLVTHLVHQDLIGLACWGRTIHTGAIDHAVASMSFENGPIATIIASRVTEHKVRAVEIIADGAYVEADLLNKTVLVHRRTFPQFIDNHHVTKYRQESVIERIHVPMSEPLMLELRHFADCVRQGRPSEVSGYDGLRALNLAETVASSIEMPACRLRD
ncbi:MAG: Gfo/Idh/MocA family oxidoreductase [Anaerolineae bacterium]|nr:Gfo/Idh/MocA family oxidoreductase [Anaerolineae bacterium]